MRQFFHLARFNSWLALATIVAIAAVAMAQEPNPKDLAVPKDRPADSKERRREGTKFEGSGRFEVTGDRVAFIPGDRAESFRVLENLAMERVTRVLGETREARQWNVAGVFTEYQGGNYLLLTRAVVRQVATKEAGR